MSHSTAAAQCPLTQEVPCGRTGAPPRRKVATSEAGGVLPRGEDDGAFAACIARMRERDQAALSELYDATSGRLYAVALRIVRVPELAEEVLSDAYFQAWRECGRYDPARGKVLAWLMIICRSRALDALRRQEEAFAHPDPHELLGHERVRSRDDDPPDLLATLQGNRQLATALESLSAVQRQLVALAFFKGLSHAEIAAHQGMPLGTVKTHVRKALAQLKDALGDAAQPD